jgi:hypothetical protein
MFTSTIFDRRPAAFEGLGLAMVDTLASNMPNAKGQKLDSSNQHSGSSSGTTLYICNL